MFSIHTYDTSIFSYRLIMEQALWSGMAGSTAMVAQVTSLMWLRTTVNYQYANGGGTMQAMRSLYKQGGLRRF